MKVIFSKNTEKYNLVGKTEPDKLKLFIDLETLGSHKVTRNEIMDALKEKVKPEVIDPGVLDSVVEAANLGEKVVERRIAKGHEAQMGSDGKILLLVRAYTAKAEVQVDSKGKASYQDLHLFDSIKTGQIVARIYPPKAGVDGMDALGQKIPSKPGKPFKTNVDKSLQVKKSEREEDEFEVVIAQQDGMLADESGRLTIRTEYVIDGNLDFHVGNVDFLGSVKVKGDVNPGFRIKAEKGIQVMGAVNGADLICPNGDIEVKGIVIGGKGRKITCGKNLKIGLAQEMEADVVGDVIIEKQCLDCVVRTASALFVTKGDLIKGRSYVVRGVQAKNLGNESGVETKIHLCSDVETSREYAELAANIKTHQNAVSVVEMHLGPYATNPARIQVLNPVHREKMQKLLTKLHALRTSLVSLEEKKTLMLGSGHSAESIKVNFEESMNIGVEILSSEEHFAVADKLAGPLTIEYNPKDKKFNQVALVPLEQVKSEEKKK